MNPANPRPTPLALGRETGVVRVICFDLDDTLCTYWDASKAGLRKAFELHGPEGIPVEECMKAWAKAFREFAPSLKQTGWYEGYLKQAEPTRTEQMRLTLRELGIEDPAMAASLSQCYLQERDMALSLFPDALEVLDRLVARYPLGLITNGPADMQRMEIATLGIGHYFKVVLIEGELGYGKPHQDVFREAEAALGAHAEECVMIGNSYSHDIEAAINAGWKTIWVRRDSDVPPSAGDEQPKPEQIPAGHPEPDAIVGDLKSILDLLPG
jgi:putative hydrolase of the HAD superfamily